MRTFFNSEGGTLKSTLARLSWTCLAALTIMSCKKKAEDPPKKTRFDLTAQIDVSNTKSDSKAKGSVTAEYLSTTKQLTYNIAYSGIEVDQIDLNHGTAEALGKGVAVLDKKGQKHASPLKGSIKLDAAAEDALFKNNLYLNIMSVKFPAGEIRGQLIVKM